MVANKLLLWKQRNTIKQHKTNTYDHAELEEPDDDNERLAEPGKWRTYNEKIYGQEGRAREEEGGKVRLDWL